MAEELRWVLIVISVFVIGGLLIHGLWSVRKRENSDEAADERVEPSQFSATSTASTEQPVSVNSDDPQIGDLSFSADDCSESQQLGAESIVDSTELPAAESNEDEQAESAPPADFIIVHIQMPEGLAMEGSKLLPAVNMLGFKYSDEGFFNRHLDPAGHGPVLFRLVNMYNPGTFDIDNMEQFSTAGISLFMTLPCDGDGLAAFNMLHSAAKKLADEFGAIILDSQREEMTVDSVREYVEKVRRFAT
ncbi:cell division protein ZipA [Pseudoalteromonas mariniglutinosa]|uniref:cell division protein ZipA n=1 Tax=Pseudoalteromonas mariniglutinosa TaxID=206042 RepID=UPI0038500945